MKNNSYIHNLKMEHAEPLPLFEDILEDILKEGKSFART